MTTKLKYFIPGLVLFMLSLSAKSQQPLPQNFIVMLDLSDRLLVTGQAHRDQQLILEVFNRFEGEVRKNLIINSKDCFAVVIAPQENGIRADEYTARLYLNMGQLPITQKRKQLEEFKSRLKTTIEKLFADAQKGKTRTSHFNGADIWRYFNDLLPHHLITTHQNKLFVISDGYLDFESNRFAGHQGNRFTDSRMLSQLRKDPSWEKTLQLSGKGLIPVRKPFGNLSVCLLEIYPKFKNVNEQDLLVALWEKWLREMKINTFEYVPHELYPKGLEKIKIF